jgi:hypothetical protein
MSELIANLDDLLPRDNAAHIPDRLTTREGRALAALIIQREITRAVGRMWALYELHDELNDEQPDGAPDAFAASLDEWWHACIGAEEAWAEAAGVRYRAGKDMKACRFYFADPDGPTYQGFTDGTTWNGFANVWVTPAVRDAIADAADAEEPWSETGKELRGLTPNADGLISLANGYAAEVCA